MIPDLYNGMSTQQRSAEARPQCTCCGDVLNVPCLPHCPTEKWRQQQNEKDTSPMSDSVRVPRVPTEAMIKAGHAKMPVMMKQWQDGSGHHVEIIDSEHSDYVCPSTVWSAMLAAAPAPAADEVATLRKELAAEREKFIMHTAHVHAWLSAVVQEMEVGKESDVLDVATVCSQIMDRVKALPRADVREAVLKNPRCPLCSSEMSCHCKKCGTHTVTEDDLLAQLNGDKSALASRPAMDEAHE